jgi:hypothetical protein
MIVGISILRATILAAIEATSEQVIATLLKNAPTYRAERDNYSNLVQIVKATESISPNSVSSHPSTFSLPPGHPMATFLVLKSP